MAAATLPFRVARSWDGGPDWEWHVSEWRRSYLRPSGRPEPEWVFEVMSAFDMRAMQEWIREVQ